MGVDLLLHHGHHVEGVPHGVEAQDPRQLLETGSGRGDHQPVKGFFLNTQICILFRRTSVHKNSA